MNQSTVTGKSRRRLEDRVYSELLDSIRFGRFALGQRLPSENELAISHEVSRPVVRSALSRLRDDGLIVSKQGAGSYVSGGSSTQSTGFAALNSITDIGTYFSFRRMIEVETAGLAAQNAKPADISNLLANIEEMEAIAHDSAEGIDPDFEFHAFVAELSDNRFLASTVYMLRSHMSYVGRFSRSLNKTGQQPNKPSRVEEHRAIVDAIAINNPDLARQKMVRHIELSERRVFKGA